MNYSGRKYSGEPQDDHANKAFTNPAHQCALYFNLLTVVRKFGHICLWLVSWQWTRLLIVSVICALFLLLHSAKQTYRTSYSFKQSDREPEHGDTAIFDQYLRLSLMEQCLFKMTSIINKNPDHGESIKHLILPNHTKDNQNSFYAQWSK